MKGVSEVVSEQGSTKWVSWVSEITETPISHGNFSLEITYKMPKKRAFLTEHGLVTETRYCNKKNFFASEKISVTEKKFMSQKQVYVRQKILLENKFPSGCIQVFITETSFCPSFRQRNLCWS